MSMPPAESVTAVTVSHVIIRACVRCQHPRELDTPCAGCGNPEPPITHDLGVQAFMSRDPARQAAWERDGQHEAARRAQTANRYVKGKE